MAKKGKFSQPRANREELTAEIAQEISLEEVPGPEDEAPAAEPAAVPAEAASADAPTPEKKPKKHRKPNRNLTIIFYTLYVLMILSVGAWIFFHSRQLNEQLVRYEQSRPEVAVEQIFEDYFTQPDWEMLYHLAEVEAGEYENRNAFVSYMNETLSGAPLHWERTVSPIRGQHAYLLKDGDTVIGLFTLENIAPYGAPYPVWDLGMVEIYVSRNHSITVLAPKGCSVRVNGVPLEEIHQISRERTKDTVWYTYRLTGLLTQPEIAVTDEDGTPVSVEYDADSNRYLAQPEGLSYAKAAVTRREVRLSFLYGDTLLFTNFYSPDTPSLLAPVVSAPAGQVFTGWYRADVDESGKTVYTLVFTPDANGNIRLPEGTVLEPMTLYALFEDIKTTDGGTE